MPRVTLGCFLAVTLAASAALADGAPARPQPAARPAPAAGQAKPPVPPRETLESLQLPARPPVCVPLPAVTS